MNNKRQSKAAPGGRADLAASRDPGGNKSCNAARSPGRSYKGGRELTPALLDRLALIAQLRLSRLSADHRRTYRRRLALNLIASRKPRAPHDALSKAPPTRPPMRRAVAVGVVYDALGIIRAGRPGQSMAGDYLDDAAMDAAVAFLQKRG